MLRLLSPHPDFHPLIISLFISLYILLNLRRIISNQWFSTQIDGFCVKASKFINGAGLWDGLGDPHLG
ncbi:hypothetical protein GIB67_026623 [Kingdonia uniflora]|uniref:Uncharacterized protein n=1 Tax=Kingdonia uniflora TaxID=39325 RepID=A0A7J7NIP2_9MAGN|nr:hypothetical protein GIB67_026623 [Kingdonia uniflora]